MKKKTRLLLLALTPLLLFALSPTASAAELEFRGLWVSSVYNLDYPSAPGLSAAKLQSEADAIIDYAMETHMTAIFLQVRPCGDALYASELFPWSAYLTGTQGKAPDGGFDPLAYFTRRCHEAGMELHAWINPYALTRTAADSREAAFALLSENHPARKVPDSVVYHSNGRLYLDLGSPEARQLVADGVAELLQNYDVDGIHFDDYFYPSTDFDDSACFAAYGGGASLEAFRRQSVNALISQIYQTVKAADPQAVFGVSPSGIWANSSHNPLGSDTSGSESYYTMYADSRQWVQDGIVDYILPQLYWYSGHPQADFTTLAHWWDDVVAGTDVKLYLGLGAYRMLEASQGEPWYGTDEILRQLDLASSQSHVSGVALFRYGSCKGNPAFTQVLTPYFQQIAQEEAARRQLEALRAAAVQKPLALLSPTSSAFFAPDAPLSLTCTAPSNSRVTAFFGGRAFSLSGTGCDYTGVVSGSENDQRPLLLVSEKNGCLQVKLSSFLVTAAKETASVKRISAASTDTAHVITFSMDRACGAAASLREGQVTLTLSPCGLAPLFEDDFLADISTTQENGGCIYVLNVPESVRAVRTDWDGTQLKLILETA